MTRGRWRLAVLVAALTVVLAVTTVVLFRDDSDPLRNGPLRDVPSHGWADTIPVGEKVTDGAEVLEITTDDVIVIEKVEFVDSEGLELLGAKVLPGPRPSAATVLERPWPPRLGKAWRAERMVDAVGARLDPRDDPKGYGWELFVGMRATKEGHLSRKIIRITYTVGDEQYVEDIPGEAVVCTSVEYESVDEKGEPDGCEPE